MENYLNWHNKRRGGEENEKTFFIKEFSVVRFTLLTNEARITSWLAVQEVKGPCASSVNQRVRGEEECINEFMGHNARQLTNFFFAVFATSLARVSTDVIVL